MKDEDKEEVRDSIRDLLDATADQLPVESPSNADLPARMDLPRMDYTTVKAGTVKSGKKLMQSLLKLYLSQDIIDNNEYIQLKAANDEATLASLMFQMQTAEHALTTLLRTIDAGEINWKMFEVLGGLQKTMLDIMKHQTLHLHAMEEGAKKLKHDIDIYSDKDEITIEKKGSGQTQGTLKRGNRSLMQDIQADITDIEVDTDENEDK